ncbi:MAG TPA: type IV pilus assembly protein PilM [Chthoniobacterales bacterium]|jgi:type IV pilus assembly protein PilM
MASNRLLSLNLGTQTVGLAEFITADNGGLILNSYQTRDLVVDGAGEGPRGPHITEAVKDLMAQMKIRAGEVNTCIPAQSVFTRFVKLPTVDEDKIDQIIGFEAQQNVPFPINEVVWDYQLVAGNDSSKLGVVLVAIKSDLLGETDHAIASTGLRTSIVDVAPMALYNAFRYNYSESKGCSLIVDIGARTTNLVFVEPQKVFSRSIPIGGGSITSAIAKDFNEPVIDAEKRKKKDGFVGLGGAYAEPGDPEVARVSKIIRNTMTRLHAEITRSVSFYRAQQQGNAPVRVYLCGGTVALPYMREFFQEKMQMPVEYFNPLRNVTISQNVNVDKVVGEAHLLGELVGLALRSLSGCPVELNLLPPEVLYRKEFARRQPFIVVASLCALLALAGWWLYFSKTADAVTVMTGKVNDEVSQLESVDQQFKNADQQIKAATVEAAPLLQAISQRESWVRLIDDLNQRIPNEKIWITVLEPLQEGKPLSFADLKVNDPKPAPTPAKPAKGPAAPPAPVGAQISAISVKGLYLDDPKVVDQLLSNLAQSPFFVLDLSKVKEINPVRQQPNQETYGYEYELRLPLKQPIPLK